MTEIDQGSPRAAQPKSSLPAGRALEISFPTFTPRITFCSERELTVEIVAGDGIGFADKVEYETVVFRDGLAILSRQEHVGKHDRPRARFRLGYGIHPCNTSERRFLRLTGRIEVKS